MERGPPVTVSDLETQKRAFNKKRIEEVNAEALKEMARLIAQD